MACWSDSEGRLFRGFKYRWVAAGMGHCCDGGEAQQMGARQSNPARQAVQRDLPYARARSEKCIDIVYRQLLLMSSSF